jgi:hypothetical protein
MAGAIVLWWVPTRGLTDDEALQVFRQVHSNLYQSFARRTEDSVYDALALSADGKLLRTIYLEVQQSLVSEETGDASASIENVEVVEVNRLSDSEDNPLSLSVWCRWNVSGTVEHWGHLHKRTNQYQARFVLRPLDGNWKLVKMEVMDQRRMRSETSLRSL